MSRRTGWTGKIWDRRYRAILISGEEDAQVAVPAPETQPVSQPKSEQELSSAPILIPTVGEEQEFAAKDDNEIQTQPKTVDSGQPPVGRYWSSDLLLVLAAIVLIGLVGLAGWFLDRHNGQPAASRPAVASPAVSSPEASNAIVPPASAIKPISAPLQVSLDFSKDCWVEAIIDGGKRRVSELRVQGESLPLEAEKSIVLMLGNAGAVDIQVNGYPLNLGKREGDVVRDLLIDLNTVQSLKSKKKYPGADL